MFKDVAGSHEDKGGCGLVFPAIPISLLVLESVDVDRDERELLGKVIVMFVYFLSFHVYLKNV